MWQKEIRILLEKFDLTHPQFVLIASLAWLSRQKQDVTQVLLSDHSKIDPMTTSTALRVLQKKGLVKRQEHSTDTRAKTVILTADGFALAKQAIKAVEAFDHAFFKPIGDKIPGFNKRLFSLLAYKS